MRNGLSLAISVAALPAVLLAAEALPRWAFFFPDQEQPQIAAENPGAKTVPGSALRYTPAQIDDLKNPPDWFPAEHPPAPNVVTHGGEGMVLACGSCHLMSGMGHPESASLAGLPSGYMQRQIADFKTGARKNPIVIDGKPQLNATQYMIAIAAGMTDADTKAASDWFASLPPQPGWVKVTEAANVPKSYISRGYMRVAWPNGGTEPIGNRIIELPQDESRQVSRDPHSGTIAYVPPGSLGKGRNLAASGGGKTIACGTCHGPELRGLNDVPAIAGRSPTYLFRQLYSFRDGSRGGPDAAQMKDVVARLDEADMVALSAYVASLTR